VDASSTLARRIAQLVSSARVKPFFSYYGGKWRAARFYPAPLPGQPVIEPFAGSAGYSTWHEPERAILIEAFEPVVGVWRYLISAPESEILALPDLEPRQMISDLKVPQEARWLMGFWVHRGTTRPGNKVTSFADLSKIDGWKHDGQVTWNAAARERIASQQHKIRLWEARLGDYSTAPETSATWFIDPPYQQVARKYAVKFADYGQLAGFCRERTGLVIVCEQSGADWMPFTQLGSFTATWGAQKPTSRVEEVVWTNSIGTVGDDPTPLG